MSACVTDVAIKAAAVASAGGEDEWFELSDRAQDAAIEDARVMLQAALPHLTYDRRPVGEYLLNDQGGSVRWLDGPPAHAEKIYTLPPHVLPSHCVELRQLLLEAIAAEKRTWTGDNRVAAWTALDAMLHRFDELAARRPLVVVDVAFVLRSASAVLHMWEDDPNVTGYMGDFGDACSILEILAQHAQADHPAISVGETPISNALSHRIEP